MTNTGGSHGDVTGKPVFGLTVTALLLAALVAAFWHTFRALWSVWQTNEDYSAGQLVPLAVGYMLWTRRDIFYSRSPGVHSLGIPIVLAGTALNLLGLYYLFGSMASLGVILCINGLALTILGWRGYRQVWFPFAFLILMAPLPNRLHDKIMLPLQAMGAKVSVVVLEVTGVPTERFGHVLEVAGYRVAVAEACSGLRMAVAFLIVAGVMAYLVNRPSWQKAIIIASSVPIALICNVFRIVFTACLYNAGYVALAQGLFHDAAGLLMMPIAVALILGELWFMKGVSSGPADPEVFHSIAPDTGR